MSIKVKKLSKEFRSLKRGRVVALHDISLEIKEGEFFIILGPSGCGKSTFLKLLAGLEKPTSGEIYLKGRLVASKEKNLFLGPKERNIAMVFQSYALYPHMSVYENIAFPLKMRKAPKGEIKVRVKEMAKLLEIENLLFAKPKELSGGEMQRVALARALIRKPNVLLLDEPLSSLDAQLRIKMREELKKMQRILGITTVYVTHDQAEALSLADKIAILKNGEIQQVGKPEEIYNEPANTFVAQFLGIPSMNLLRAKVIEEKTKIFIETLDIRLKPSSELVQKLRELNLQEIIVGIRAEDLKLTQQKPFDFEAEIKLIEHLGAEKVLYLNVKGEKLLLRTPYCEGLREDEIVKITIDPKKIHIFNKDGIRVKWH